MDALRKKKTGKGLFTEMRKYRYAYILILPAMVFMLVFAYLPIGGIVIAFQDFDIIKGFFRSQWVGFDNFVRIFHRPDILHAIQNTVVYGAVILFVGFPFPIMLALLFNELQGARFKKIVQTISYMPHFLSWISVIGLFYGLLATEGPVNQLLGKIIGESYEAKNILLDSKNFLAIIFGTHIWKGIGWGSVLYLAAIAGVDQTLYEAASVDGCGRFRQVFAITLPCIKNTVVIALVMSLGTLVSVNFEQVYGFQNIFTQQDTDTVNTLVYRLGILNGEYSLSTAFGLSQGVVSLCLLLIANRLSRKIMAVSIW